MSFLTVSCVFFLSQFFGRNAAETYLNNNAKRMHDEFANKRENKLCKFQGCLCLRVEKNVIGLMDPKQGSLINANPLSHS